MTTTPIAPAAIAPSNEEIRAMLQPLLAEPSADLKVAAERLWNEAQDEACKHLHAGNELPADLIWRLQIHDWAAKAFDAPVLIRAALSRLSRAPATAAQGCPAGWRLVPKEPPLRFLERVFGGLCAGETPAPYLVQRAQEKWADWLAAAPVHQAAAEPAPEQPVEEVGEEPFKPNMKRRLDHAMETAAYVHDLLAGRPSPEPAAPAPDAATQCTCNPRNSNHLVDHHDQDCGYVRACEDALERHPILHPRYRRAVAPAPEEMVDRVALTEANANESFDNARRLTRAVLAAPAAEGAPGWPSLDEIRRERQRQISEEGWTPEHDDEHIDGALLRAAVYYYQHGARKDIPLPTEDDGTPIGWPWDAKWWKPKDPRRDLIRAGALCLAEKERLLRKNPSSHVGHVDFKLDLIIAALSRLAQPGGEAPKAGAAEEVGGYPDFPFQEYAPSTEARPAQEAARHPALDWKLSDETQQAINDIYGSIRASAARAGTIIVGAAEPAPEQPAKEVEQIAAAAGRMAQKIAAFPSPEPTAPAPPARVEAHPGDLDPHDDVEKTVDIVRRAYGWTIDYDGRLFGLIAGDQGYAATSIIVPPEDVRAAAEGPNAAPAPEERSPHEQSPPRMPASGTYPLSYVGVVPQKPAPAPVEPDAATQCTCNPRNSNHLVDHHDQDCGYVRACEDALERHPILHPRYRRVAAAEPAPEQPAKEVGEEPFKPNMKRHLDHSMKTAAYVYDRLAGLGRPPPEPGAPGHTDLMASPESIDAFLDANPPPPEPAAPAPEVMVERAAQEAGEVQCNGHDHDYTSTACYHALHDRCRQSCKFCGVECACTCHGTGRLPQPSTDEPAPEAKPLDPAIMDDYLREMHEKVIPEIEANEREQAILAARLRHVPLFAAPEGIGEVELAILLYADSYRAMAKMGDGRVDCANVDYDIRTNILASVRAAIAAAPAQNGVDRATVEKCIAVVHQHSHTFGRLIVSHLRALLDGEKEEKS